MASATQLRNSVRELFQTPRLLDASHPNNLIYLQKLAEKIPDLTSSQLPPLNVTILSEFNWIKVAADYAMTVGGGWLAYEVGHVSYQRYQGEELTPDQLQGLMIRGGVALVALLGGYLLSGISKLEIKSEEQRIEENYRIALAFEPFKRLVQLASEMPGNPNKALEETEDSKMHETPIGSGSSDSDDTECDLDEKVVFHLAAQEAYDKWCAEWALAKEAFLRAVSLPEEHHQ